MKRNFKSVLAVCLIAAILIPTACLKNNKSNSGLHNIVVSFHVDPFPEE